jgi:hypothetical protein
VRGREWLLPESCSGVSLGQLPLSSKIQGRVIYQCYSRNVVRVFRGSTPGESSDLDDRFYKMSGERKRAGSIGYSRSVARVFRGSTRDESPDDVFEKDYVGVKE